MTWPPSCLAPNEHLAGDDAERLVLAERLAAIRATPRLDQAHPNLTFSLLPWVLGSPPYQGKPADLFFIGATLITRRYEALGLTQRLPFERVWVGIRSKEGAFGGFHHPDQGYRHLQMGALITRYGDLTAPTLPNPEIIVLDLLRSYVHDCLHYGSYRLYRLWDDEIGRARYGINSREPSGRTYSAPDPEGSTSTRNLGIVMEGATDREATTVTRETARIAGLTESACGIDRYVFREITGQLTARDLKTLRDPAKRRLVAPSVEADGFLKRMGSYAENVDNRYKAFLNEIGGHRADELHILIVKAMISGSREELSDWLNRRHGEEAFAVLFKAPGSKRAD